MSAEELLRLANLGWCDRDDLDRAMVAVGGEVYDQGGHAYYRHPIVGKPSSAAKMSRKDAGSGLRAYARQVARALLSGPREEKAPEPVQVMEAQESERYRPPAAMPASERGEVLVRQEVKEEVSIESFVEGAIALAQKMDRAEERSAARAAERESWENRRLETTILAFVIDPPADAPVVTAQVCHGDILAKTRDYNRVKIDVTEAIKDGRLKPMGLPVSFETTSARDAGEIIGKTIFKIKPVLSPFFRVMVMLVPGYQWTDDELDESERVIESIRRIAIIPDAVESMLSRNSKRKWKPW